MQPRIYLSPPHMGESEFKFVQEAFESNWVAPIGPQLDAFEKDLQAYNGVTSCVALSSGTAAIHLALILLGVKPGDEVLCSSFTFAGSCFPVKYLNATPVFIDSEDETWNIDPRQLEEAITDRIKSGKKPKALIAVHLYGMPFKVDEILNICKKYEIPLIEDAAEALGSQYNGKKLGTFGDFGIYSFNGNKIITTSSGGALVSNNVEWTKKAKFLSTQAREPFPYYEHEEVGFNYRLSNISAAIGRGQLKVLDDRVERRRQIFETYKSALNNYAGVTFPAEINGYYSNRWLTTILIDHPSVTPESVRLDLESHNIESRPLWKPMHLQPVFKDCPRYENGVSANLFKKGLCLPSGSSLTDLQQEKVIELIKQTLSAS